MTGLLNPDVWAGLSGPGIATFAAVALIWAVATQRLVPGKQYRAAEARGDKYENAYLEATTAIIRNTAGQEATLHMVSAFREEVAEIAAAAKEPT